jgi:dimethylamine/trimethylamine dehydrogenase
MAPRQSDANVLVVGGGPAGLEAAQALGKRGYDVVLAEAGDEFGGRVTLEARLPGLSAWIRVVDYRLGQLQRQSSVETAPGSPVDADEILSYGFEHVAIATGARWRADGVGRFHTRPIPLDPALAVFTPDELMRGTLPPGERIVVFDDDHYYMGGVLAELLRQEGRDVTLVTPAIGVSIWTNATMEQHRIQRRLLELGVTLETSRAVTATAPGGVTTVCAFTGEEREIGCDAAVFVTARLPQEQLYRELLDRRADWEAAGVRTVTAVGDCWSPGTIAQAVWDGHRYAEELDGPDQPGEGTPFRREVTALSPDWTPAIVDASGVPT